MDTWADYRESYAAEDKTRIREHVDTWIDIIDMNETGSQGLAQYKFTDESYFADSEGSPITDPPGKSTEWQLTIERAEDGTYYVIRMVAGADTIQ